MLNSKIFFRYYEAVPDIIIKSSQNITEERFGFNWLANLALFYFRCITLKEYKTTPTIDMFNWLSDRGVTHQTAGSEVQRANQIPG